MRKRHLLILFVTLINSEQLAALGSECLLLDCRFDLADPRAGRSDYLKGHLPGAIFVDVDQDLTAHPGMDAGRHPLPSPAEMSKLFRRLGVRAQQQVVVYDGSGGLFAARLWWMLRAMGHPGTAVLDGGIQAWRETGRDLETQANTATGEGDFDGAWHADRWVSADALAQVPRLVDSRDPARYRGDSEPIDPVAGHIPGALNRFCRDNLTATGSFADQAALQRDFAALFASIPASETVFYCGSGVTACHNLLAAVHAGFDLPRLYSGSWSEWCSDPNRPVATGSDP